MKGSTKRILGFSIVWIAGVGSCMVFLDNPTLQIAIGGILYAISDLFGRVMEGL